MSFISDLLIEISSFRIRVGNKLNALANRIGNLSNLTTTNKNSLVEAVNEVKDGSIQTLSVPTDQSGGVSISDGNVISILNLGRPTIQNFDSIGSEAKTGISGFYNTSGSVGYPASTGQGILSLRGTSSTAGSFALWTSGSNDGLIYANVGTSTGWVGWRSIVFSNDLKQLTVNTTSDLVGGFVYFPNGSVTATLGLSSVVLNAIVDGQTAYNWGDHNTAGYATQIWTNQRYLNIFNNTGYISPLITDLNNAPNATRGLANIQENKPQAGFSDIVVISQYGNDDQLQLELPFRGNNRLGWRTKSSSGFSDWVRVWYSGNFNPAQYVLQSSLNTQLDNYVPVNGVTTINNTKTFTSSPVVPNATLNSHAVNLGQLNSILSGYATNENVAYFNDGDNVNSNVAWGSNVVGGARNQVQGARNIVKGEDINIFGSRNVSSGINNQINGFASVVNGAFNTLTGAYSSIAGSQANIVGNYLFARDKQTVLGMYNKVYDVGADEGLRFAFGTGMNDLDKFNAVEIYDDHRTEFHGRSTYNRETRNPAWFTEDYTHVDTYQVGYDHLPHRAPGSTPCEANILRLAVRHGSNSASNDDRFTAVADLKKAFNVHGIVDGSIFDGTINVNRIHTKGTLEFSPTTTSKLITDAKIDTKNLLIVRYNFGKGLVDIIGYTDSASLLSHKTEPSSVTVLLGSFILRKNNLGQPVAFFEFNQQII